MEKVTTSIRVLIPDETRNYIQNPAIRQDTSGWISSGSAISRATNRARFGFSSLQVVTSGLAVNEGTYYRVNALEAYDSACTVSAYVRGDGEVRIRIISSGGKQWYSETIDLTDERWTRIEITGRCQKTNDVRLYIETDGDSAQAVTFYVDGAQMELHPYSTTYCDGEQDGCIWTANFDASESIRPDRTRLGGRWIPITGPLREDDSDIFMTLVTGAGMAPMDVNVQSYATKPGGYFDNTKVRVRILQLTFFTRDTSGKSASIQRLHHLKQELIDILKPDRTYGDEPILLEYTVADNPPLYINVRYDGGLDGAWDVRNKWSNGFVLRLTAVDPFWYEDSQEIAELDSSGTQEDSTIGLARKSALDGSWDFIPVVGSGALVSMAQHPINGDLYFLFENDVWTWNGTTATKIGVVQAGNAADIAVARDSKVWVCGTNGLQVSGVAENLVYYDGVWNGVATPNGGAAWAWALIVDVENGVYIAASNAGVNWPFFRYDGSWNAPGVSSGATFSAVIAGRNIQISADKRYVYVSGSFGLNLPSGESSLGTLKYDIKNDEFVDEVGNEGSTGGFQLLVAEDGQIYNGGAGASLVRYFNNSTWADIDFPFGGDVLLPGSLVKGGNTFAPYKGGFLIGGDGAPTLQNNHFLLFRDGLFAEMDFITLDPTTAIETVFVDKNGNLYLDATTGEYSVINTIENIGSAFVEPKLYIKNEGIMNFIENFTQDVQVYFDLGILSNEEVIIDFGSNTVESNIRGTLRSEVSYLSEMSSFFLMPKTNQINLFIRKPVDIEARMAYIPRHWSVDAVARKEDI